MAKPEIQYVCQSCGTAFTKWAGKCGACNAWNTLVEETVSAAPGGLKAASGATRGKVEFVALDDVGEAPPRHQIGVEELDRVFGGGLSVDSHD